MNIDAFEKWLKQYGCEILPVASSYERFRFKGNEVGVIYHSGKTSGEYCNHAIHCFNLNRKWDGAPVSTGRNRDYRKQKRLLLKRDGRACFYCAELMGEDISLEHLQPLTSKGPNTLSNMVLAHQACNQEASHMTIVEKVNLAIKKRVEKFTKQIQQNEENKRKEA